MKRRGRIHVLKTGWAVEHRAYLVSIYPDGGGGWVPDRACVGQDELRRVLRTLGAEGDTLERTLREAEEGKSQSLELAIDERNLRALGFM
jgi:hypothetical protein